MAKTFSSKHFGYSAKMNLLATEVSVLERSCRSPIWERLYETSDDQGFIVRSEQTGAEAAWFVSEVDVREGEIQGWRLKPTLETLARIPALKGARMLVVNT